MRKPRIAVFGEKFFPSRGGTSRVVESTVRHLAERYDFTVFCYADPAAADNVPGVRTVQLPRPRLGSAGVFLYLARGLRRLLREDWDLVHVHKTDASFALPWLTRRFPCVATSHEVAYLNDKWSLPARLYFRAVERVFVRSRATLTCVSGEQQRHYRERFGREVHHVPNGVDELAFDDAAAERLLSEQGLRPGFLLFAARRVIPLKGLHTLLDALHALDFRGQLLVLGDMEQLPSYSRDVRARARGLDVRFGGYVAERATLLALVRRAGLFAFPSEREGMSVMLLEAAACGTPVVCSDIPQNTDVLGPEQALTFASGDAAALARALADLLGRPDEARAMGARARSGVLERFGSAGVARAYDRIYRAVLREADPARWPDRERVEACPPEAR